MANLTLQANEKGTKLIDEDGLFSLVAAAPEAAAPSGAAAGPGVTAVKAEGSEVHAIPSGNFYAGKASATHGSQAKKAALASSSLAASGISSLLRHS